MCCFDNFLRFYLGVMGTDSLGMGLGEGTGRVAAAGKRTGSCWHISLSSDTSEKRHSTSQSWCYLQPPHLRATSGVAQVQGDKQL